MLLEAAIGDAYGAGFEFVPVKDWAKHGLVNNAKSYFQHPELTIGNGRYTDDTQMMIAVAEAMLKGGEFLADELCHHVYRAFSRDPRQGYGKRFYEVLTEATDGNDLLKRLDGKNGSTRSGGAMRVAPIGLYKDVKFVKSFSILQAMLTHNTPEGMGAACAVALMVHYLAWDLGPKAEVADFILDHHSGYAWDEDWNEWASVQGYPCAHRAITVVRQANTMTEVLKLGVQQGGDVDTVCAIAMAAASVCDEIAKDIPAALYEGLEDGPFGADFLVGLDLKLSRFALMQ